MKIRTLAVHVLMLSGIVGCRGGAMTGGVTDSVFVATMSSLNRINADESRDSTSRAAARDSVLQGRDLTMARLERAARSLSDDPDRALAVWQRVMKESGPAVVR
jgi:hypothetical protein